MRLTMNLGKHDGGPTRPLVRHLVVTVLAAGAALAQAGEIRVAHALSDDSHVGRALAKVSERLARETQGRLVLKPMGNSSAGNDQKAMADAIDGKLEVFISSTATIAAVHHPLRVWDTPFLFQDRDEAHAVLDSPIGRQILEGASAGGLVGLSYWELGFRHLTNNVRPVTRIDHLAGLRVRTMPSELAIATMKRLGADAKPLPFPQLRQALADGSFDGQENPLPTIVSARLHEVQKHLTLTKHLYGVYGVMASKKWWDSLAAADRELVNKAFQDLRLYQRDESQRATDEALATMKAAGVKVAELETGQRWLIGNRLERVLAPIAGEVGLPTWIAVNSELMRVREKSR